MRLTMVDSNYILAPPIVKVRFDIAPAFNGLDSIRTITETQRLSGFSEWVTQMAAALSKERTDLNILVFDAFMPLFYDVMPAMIGYESYSEYVDAVAAADPYQLRDA